MVVKHIGTDGRVRRTFEDVHNFWRHDHSNIVSVCRRVIDPKDDILPEAGYRRYNYDYPVALIHLAEGESLEMVQDEPTRS